MPIITRDTAIRRGLLYYYTGQPCKHGHLAPRYVRNYECTACARAYEQRIYSDPQRLAHKKAVQAEWRRTNRDFLLIQQRAKRQLRLERELALAGNGAPA